MGANKNLIKVIGPGLLYAGAAIGVSHLVQSTRAGAKYGFLLVGVVLLANVLKYPFFEFGPRYAIATGESLIDGYKKMGDWALALYVVLTFSTMFTIQAAVTVVTAGLAENLFKLSLGAVGWSALLLIICLLILLIGKFSFLDKLMKIIIIALTLTTIIALAGAVGIKHPEDMTQNPFDFGRENIIFLIALMGWMPAPIDISVWHSIWSLEKIKASKYTPTLREGLLDFHIGYWATTFLALCFLSLGALVMFGSGEVFSSSGAVFAGQFIDLYTRSLGQWAYFIIAIAAFTTMFSTTITVLDAAPRVLKRTTEIVLAGDGSSKKSNSDKFYWIWIIILAAGALVLLSALSGGMTFMVDLATTMSFLTAPLLAFLNYRLVNSKYMPEQYRPKGFILVVSWIGMAFLVIFSIIFLASF